MAEQGDSKNSKKSAAKKTADAKSKAAKASASEAGLKPSGQKPAPPAKIKNSKAQTSASSAVSPEGSPASGVAAAKQKASKKQSAAATAAKSSRSKKAVSPSLSGSQQDELKLNVPEDSQAAAPRSEVNLGANETAQILPGKDSKTSSKTKDSLSTHVNNGEADPGDREHSTADPGSSHQADPEEVVIDVNASLNRHSPTRQEILLAWWKAARPPFYIATLVPLFLGYFAARNDVWSLSTLVFVGVLLVGFILHLCANLANDLFDYLLETDTQETIGGSRGLQDGTITVRQLRLALAGCYGLAAVLTIMGVWITGLWGLLLVALFGALASYYYVAPPIMYGYRALGELFVFISMGVFMVGGSYYALAGELQPYVLALSFPVGLGVAGILYYQSLPEIETDAAVGKRTLVGVLGPEKAIFLFKLWWPAIWFLVLTLYLAGLAAWPALLGIVLGLPFYLKACRRLAEFGGDWFSLDKYGKYVRAMYMLMGIFLLLGVAQA